MRIASRENVDNQAPRIQILHNNTFQFTFKCGYNDFISKYTDINPSSPKGGGLYLRFSPWCSKSHSQGVKLLRVPSSSSFPFILAKKFRTYHLHRG